MCEVVGHCRVVFTKDVILIVYYGALYEDGLHDFIGRGTNMVRVNFGMVIGTLMESLCRFYMNASK